MKNMKFALYCRKSTEDSGRQVLSLQSQNDEMIKLAKTLDLNIVQVFTESKSAKKPNNRPQFTELMKLIEKGKIDGILCWKIDRLSRNPIDSATIQWYLQQGNLKLIQTIDKQYQPSDNALIYNVESGMANQYIRELSVNVKRGMSAKLDKGEWPNKAPIGYLNVNRKIIIDTERAPFVVKAFELYKTSDKSVKEIANILYSAGFRSRGGNKYHKSKIHLILSNPFYCGIMVKKDRKYLGVHKPIISKQLFDDVQDVFLKKAHTKKQTIDFAFRGLLKCLKCGCVLTATKKKEKHIYYYCTNGKNTCDEHKVYLTEEDVSNEMSSVFDHLIFDDELIEMCYHAKKEEIANKQTFLNQSQVSLNSRLRKLKERQNSLLDAFLDKDIDKDTYDEKNRLLKNEEVDILKELEEVKSKITISDEKTLERIKNCFLEPKQRQSVFLATKPDEQRNLLISLLWNAEFANKKIANLQFKQPYDAMSKVVDKSDFSSMLGDRDSNPDSQDQNLKSYH